MPVTYGLHLTRAYMRQAKEHGHSCAVILLDLKEAFYRILRPLCMDGPLTDEMLARLMHTLKMPEDALHELRKIMEEPTALREAGLPELEQRSVRAVHLQTHFWMRHQTDVVQTHHGTRPGDPFADIVFSYVWARVMHRLQHFMKQHDLLSTFPRFNQLLLFEQPDYGSLPSADFIGPTWMDDLAICLQSQTGEEVVQKVGMVASRLLELCIEHGMTPNLSKNKTEVASNEDQGAHEDLRVGEALSPWGLPDCSNRVNGSTKHPKSSKVQHSLIPWLFGSREKPHQGEKDQGDPRIADIEIIEA